MLRTAALVLLVGCRCGPDHAPAGMVWVPGGAFDMGSDLAILGDDVRPVHRVQVTGFWMDETEVTNAAFGAFADATSYVTLAEQAPRAEDYPGVPPEALVAGSGVFTPPPVAVPLDDNLGWWRYVPGASWRHPGGPGTDARDDHPVVHVAWDDAVAFCAWAGKRLPTEAEWERAARGGLSGEPFVWGAEPDVTHTRANTFQGPFPHGGTTEDGWSGAAPVGTFPPNGYGLYDMAGNVWEWVADWYRPDTYRTRPAAALDPQGPAHGYDPQEPGVAKRVQRGGSWLCTDQYCGRYRAAGRGKGAPDTGTDHVGFRCVKR